MTWLNEHGSKQKKNKNLWYKDLFKFNGVPHQVVMNYVGIAVTNFNDFKYKHRKQTVYANSLQSGGNFRALATSLPSFLWNVVRFSQPVNQSTTTILHFRKSYFLSGGQIFSTRKSVNNNHSALSEMLVFLSALYSDHTRSIISIIEKG